MDDDRTRWHWTPHYPSDSRSWTPLEGVDAEESIVMYSDDYPRIPRTGETPLYVVRDNPGVPYTRTVHRTSLDDWSLNGESLGDYIRTHMRDAATMDSLMHGSAYFDGNGAHIPFASVAHDGENSQPFTVQKYAAYIQVSHDAPDSFPHSLSHLSRLQRVRSRFADTRYKIRMRLASWIAGYDIEDHES